MGDRKIISNDRAEPKKYSYDAIPCRFFRKIESSEASQTVNNVYKLSRQMNHNPLPCYKKINQWSDKKGTTKTEVGLI